MEGTELAHTMNVSLSIVHKKISKDIEELHNTINKLDKIYRTLNSTIE